MLTLYVVCALLGGGLLLAALLGGHDHLMPGHLPDHPAPDHGPPGSLSSGSPSGGWAELGAWLNLRALVSFVAFFGLAGLVFTLLGSGPVVSLLLALVAGLAVGAVSSLAFRLARTRGEAGTVLARLEGRTGTVLVPPRGEMPGKVSILAAGQSETRLARSQDLLAPGDRILIITEERGVLDVRRWDGA